MLERKSDRWIAITQAVLLHAVVIGGSTFGDGNVISFNGAGVASDFISNILISHNKIGTDASGNNSAGNGSGLFLNDGSNITITLSPS